MKKATNNARAMCGCRYGSKQGYVHSTMGMLAAGTLGTAAHMHVDWHGQQQQAVCTPEVTIDSRESETENVKT